ARWRGEADWLVVSTHWGSMYVDYPHPRVLATARALADAGADVVLGHHPHVMQGAERLGRTLVLYSLGDGVFNSHAGDFHATVADAVRPLSGVFTATLASGAHGLALAPHVLDPDGFAAPADAATATRIVERVRALSAGLAQGGVRFAAESAPTLLRYELEGIGHYLRQGRLDKIARVLLSVRPRHAPLLWQAITRPRKAS
ncbi:MAG TPA: CapA family protein, partial [Candidatus Acidoferrales bacterium]|nr:CapA family protein [Candidatus Acidoferrales bacterium]